MNITNGEKIILLMLSEIYDKLAIEGEIEPDFIRSAIFSDNTWSIPWKYTGIPFEKNETPEIVTEVLNILDMWSMIERSYKNLSDDEKETINKNEELSENMFVFEGFDGNNESEYMGTASFLVNELNRFVEFKDRDFNSHYPTVESYKRMLGIFEPIFKSLNYRMLSKQQLIDIMHGRRLEK